MRPDQEAEMIVARLRNGADWEWQRGDRVSVNGQSFELGSVAALELDDVRLGGRDVEVGGRVWRDLVATDPATGIHVVLSMPVELAREVGLKLSSLQSIVLATELPPSGGQG